MQLITGEASTSSMSGPSLALSDAPYQFPEKPVLRQAYSRQIKLVSSCTKLSLLNVMHVEDTHVSHLLNVTSCFAVSGNAFPIRDSQQEFGAWAPKGSLHITTRT